MNILIPVLIVIIIILLYAIYYYYEQEKIMKGRLIDIKNPCNFTQLEIISL